MSAFNTGSDLDIEKLQEPFTVVNGRIGVHGADERWGFELWAQNLFDKNIPPGRVRRAAAGARHDAWCRGRLLPAVDPACTAPSWVSRGPSA
jgi:hypothetical protein